MENAPEPSVDRDTSSEWDNLSKEARLAEANAAVMKAHEKRMAQQQLSENEKELSEEDIETIEDATRIMLEDDDTPVHSAVQKAINDDMLRNYKSRHPYEK